MAKREKSKKKVAGAGISAKKKTRGRVETAVWPRSAGEKSRISCKGLATETILLAMEELETSRRRYADLYDFAPMGCFTFDKKGLIRETNLTGARMLGLDGRSLINKQFSHFIAREDREIFHTHCADVAEKGVQQTCEITLRRKGGLFFNAQLQSVPAEDAAGDAVYCRTAMIDTTDRKKAESALSHARMDAEQHVREMDAVISNIAEPVVIYNSEGSMTRANPAAVKSYGFDPNDLSQEKFRTFIESIRLRHLDGTLLPVEELPSRRALRGEATKDKKLIFTDLQGDNHFIEASCAPVVMEDRIVGCVLAWHDVTEIRNAEMEIHRLNEDLAWRNAELEAVNKELEAFSYTVSHDLKAPLRSIEGFTRALTEDYRERLDETGRDYLRRVNSASERMSQLIDALLTMSRLTKAELTEKTVNLSNLARVVADGLRRKEPDRKVDFVIAIGITAKGDPGMLEVVIENLLSNAWKFTNRHVAAKIEFGVTENGGKRAYFIRDDGAGFAPEFADKLFSPFRRLHSEAEFPGLGIGLATVERIIRRHGGSIRAEGEPEKGATFFFTLP